MTIDSMIFFLSMFAKGTANALFLLVATALIASVIAAVLTVLDVAAPRPVRWLVRCYSWLAQTTPPLILLFVAFYGSSALGWFISPMAAALCAFVFFAAAYYFEILRASFNGVPRDQFEAACALGIPPHRFVFKVVMPQMLKIAAGPYIGRTTVLLKETSLASAISVPEIMNITSGFVYSGSNPLLLIGVAGLIYIFLNLALISLEGRLSSRKAAQ